MSVRTGTFRVHHSLRNAFPVEVRHLFKQQKIFKHHRPARPNRQRILVVAHRTSGIRCHNVFLSFSHSFLLSSINSAKQASLLVIPSCSSSLTAWNPFCRIVLRRKIPHLPEVSGPTPIPPTYTAETMNIHCLSRH